VFSRSVLILNLINSPKLKYCKKSLLGDVLAQAVWKPTNNGWELNRLKPQNI